MNSAGHRSSTRPRDRLSQSSQAAAVFGNHLTCAQKCPVGHPPSQWGPSQFNHSLVCQPPLQLKLRARAPSLHLQGHPVSVKTSCSPTWTGKGKTLQVSLASKACGSPIGRPRPWAKKHPHQRVGILVGRQVLGLQDGLWTGSCHGTRPSVLIRVHFQPFLPRHIGVPAVVCRSATGVEGRGT